MKPGASVGTTNRAGLSLPVLASWVRATISTDWASSTPEMKVFCPLSTHSSPSRVPVVVMLWALEPASASVMPNAISRVPSAIPGSHLRLLRARCRSG